MHIIQKASRSSSVTLINIAYKSTVRISRGPFNIKKAIFMVISEDSFFYCRHVNLNSCWNINGMVRGVVCFRCEHLIAGTRCDIHRLWRSMYSWLTVSTKLLLPVGLQAWLLCPCGRHGSLQKLSWGLLLFEWDCHTDNLSSRLLLSSQHRVWWSVSLPWRHLQQQHWYVTWPCHMTLSHDLGGRQYNKTTLVWYAGWQYHWDWGDECSPKPARQRWPAQTKWW